MVGGHANVDRIAEKGLRRWRIGRAGGDEKEQKGDQRGSSADSNHRRAPLSVVSVVEDRFGDGQVDRAPRIGEIDDDACAGLPFRAGQ
ncbi:hypothetical protein Misp01_52720 [Microtetraspora sp. NBRC 13810]|nr:hypothetical protein Misp01_52720 [Microtetraspora sp. NBRC 13810]